MLKIYKRNLCKKCGFGGAGLRKSAGVFRALSIAAVRRIMRGVENNSQFYQISLHPIRSLVHKSEIVFISVNERVLHILHKHYNNYLLVKLFFSSDLVVWGEL